MARPGHPLENLGGRIGPKIAVLISHAMREHEHKARYERSRTHAEGLNEFFRGMSLEKAAHTADFWNLFLGGENTPPEVEKLLQFIANGGGELSEVMGSLGLGGAVGTSITSAIANYLSPLNQGLIAAAPYAIIDAGSMARAEAVGIQGPLSFYAEAARAGLSAGRFNVLKELSEQYPGLGELLELLRRGLITQAEAGHALRRDAVPENWVPTLLALERVHLSPADAALAVLRGAISEAQGAAIAAASGINGPDFHTLVYNTGEPPGLEQLLEAYRRGFIDDARLNLGIRQSRVRDEWHDVVEKLRFEPASTADAVNAVVQGHLPHAAALQIAEWNGQRPEDFDWMVENAGNPMSPMEAIQLWNHAVIDQGRVEEAIREGRTKDKYIGNLLHLRVKLPPLFQTVKMVTSGGISPARGAQLLHAEGYEADVVAGMIHSATSEQAAKAKALAQAEVSSLYEEKALTREEAIGHLRILGLSPANAALVLKVADLKRERKLLDAATGKIRSEYIARHIDETEASGLLDKLLIPAAQRDFLLELWTIDRASVHKVLTPAQILTANKLGRIDDSDTERRLMQHGYTQEDARILLDSEKGRTKPAP